MQVFRSCPRLLALAVAAVIVLAAGARAADDAESGIKSLPPPVVTRPPLSKSVAPVSGTAVSRPDKGKDATAAACSPFVFSPSEQLPNGSVHQPYLFRILTSGGTTPVSFALDKQSHLPPGLKLETSGLVTGMPQQSGEFAFTIAAFDTCPQGSRNIEKGFKLIINEAPPSQMMIETTIPQQAEERPAGQEGVIVTQLTLAFAEGQSSLVVARNAKVPDVVARLTLKGRGVVAGYWITPRNPRLFFQQPVQAPEGRLTLPAGDLLPSDVAGSHEIRLVLSSPRAAFPGAVARYVVTGDALPPKDYVERQVVVTVALDAKARMAADLAARYGLRLLQSYDLASLSQAILAFETDGDPMALAAQLEGEEGVLLAQPNHVFHTLSEPRSALQSLSRQLHFAKVHDVSRGRNVSIAVIDTGVDIDHEDLRENIRDAENFIPEEAYRPEIHGTAVAGIIAAGLNGTGIAGVAPEAKILALRACKQLSEREPQGQGYSVSIARAIDAALVRKADIVNMSFGSARRDRLITRLIETGAERGILFVAPAGNREDLDALPFPASFDRVVAVGGVKENGEVFPNRKLAAAAAVCAPCEHLFTTTPGNRYNFLDGTSISAGVVSGVLALALEKRPVLRREDLPAAGGDIQGWTETLLGISLGD